MKIQWANEAVSVRSLKDIKAGVLFTMHHSTWDDDTVFMRVSISDDCEKLEVMKEQFDDRQDAQVLIVEVDSGDIFMEDETCSVIMVDGVLECKTADVVI